MALRVTAESENEPLGNENESLRLPEPVCSCYRTRSAQHYVESETAIRGCLGNRDENISFVRCEWRAVGGDGSRTGTDGRSAGTDGS